VGPELNYLDYYSMMSYKDFTEYAANVAAGTADSGRHGISTRTDTPTN